MKNSGMQVQIIGVIVSLMGAIVAEFFKGPLIRPSSHHLRYTKQLFVFSSTPEFWVFGGILLAAASFSVSITNFIQVLLSFLTTFQITFWIFNLILVNLFICSLHTTRKKLLSNIKNQWRWFLIIPCLGQFLVQ